MAIPSLKSVKMDKKIEIEKKESSLQVQAAKQVAVVSSFFTGFVDDKSDLSASDLDKNYLKIAQGTSDLVKQGKLAPGVFYVKSDGFDLGKEILVTPVLLKNVYLEKTENGQDGKIEKVYTVEEFKDKVTSGDIAKEEFILKDGSKGRHYVNQLNQYPIQSVRNMALILWGMDASKEVVYSFSGTAYSDASIWIKSMNKVSIENDNLPMQAQIWKLKPTLVRDGSNSWFALSDGRDFQGEFYGIIEDDEAAKTVIDSYNKIK